jgi:putative oxidoreductase
MINVPFFQRFASAAYFLLRVFAGLLFACHGAQKLFGVLGGTRFENNLMLVAGVVELFGGLLIAVGFLTQIAAFLSAGEMAVAYVMVHAPQGFWPIQNQGELALLYLFIFLYVMCSGAGRFSVDSYLAQPKPA